ncbi:MAG: ATP synthase F1 subunit gamma [Patescibacteria group bacterium]
MALKDIKEKIQSVQKTAKVTKAMESVSAVKMRRAQEDAIRSRPYTHAAFSILRHLSYVSKMNVDQMYDFHTKDSGRICIVLITSSKGLSGALNANIFKKLESLLEVNNWDTQNTDFICVGKKGREYVERKGYKVIHTRDQFDDNDAGPVLREISDLCLDLFHHHDYQQIHTVYTNFISTTEQEAVSGKILPIKHKEIEEFIREAIPRSGRYSNMHDFDFDKETEQTSEYLYEPDPETLIKHLVPHLLYIGLYHSLLESKASEHSARMIAMKNATDKANEVASDLNREYNKARQAAITQEISEIVTGMETM